MFTLMFVVMLAIMAGFIFAVRTADISAGSHPVIIAGVRRQQLAAAKASRAVRGTPTLWAQVSGLITLTPFRPVQAWIHRMGVVIAVVTFLAAVAIGAAGYWLLTADPVVATATATVATTSAGFGIHSIYKMPGWIRHEGGMLLVKTNAFALAIPEDLDGVQYFHLYVPAGDGKRVDIKNLASCEMIEVPLRGQRARVDALFIAVENRDWREAGRLSKSLATYSAKIFEIDVWQHVENMNVPRALRQYGEGHEFKLHGQVTEQRRHCYAVGIKHRLVKVTGDGTENIEAALNALTSDEDTDETVEGQSIREDSGLKIAIQESVLPHYEEQGFVLAGGSPDAGLMLFVEPETLEGINSAESAQRAAKILLRGGVALRCEARGTIAAELVDFESGKYGKRDGLFMVVDDAIMAPLARKGGVASGFSYQGQYVDIGTSMMKGMVYSVGPDTPIEDLKKLLASSEIPAVVDIGLWNKVIDTGAEVGDIVEIDPTKLWVMESDRKSKPKTVRLSPQAMERSGALKPWFNTKMSRGLDVFTEDVMAGKYGEYLSPFTRIGKLAQAGIPGFTADKDAYEAELARSAAQYARKGVRVRGAGARFFYDDNLSVDMGNQVPGARVPESWGLEVGDRLVLVAYPALPALDIKGRNTCIFVAEVEETSARPHISLHGDVGLTALRDEDGDKLIAILPEEEDAPLPAVGQAKIKLSTRLTGMEAAKAGADAAAKQEVFGASIDSGSLAARSARVFDVYMRLGAQVGIVDNTVSSIMLYLGDRLYNVETPTGEHATVFMSKAIQASIEGMKHVVDERYSRWALQDWAIEVLPGAFEVDPDTGREKFVGHPALTVRKAVKRGESALIDHLDALDALLAAENAGDVSTTGNWAMQIARFVARLPYYTAKDGGDDVALVKVNEQHLIGEETTRRALRALHGSTKIFLGDEQTYDTCAGAAGRVRQLATAAGRRAAGAAEAEKGLAFWQAETKYLRLAGMRMRFGMRPAERLAIDIHWLHEAAKSAKGSGRLKCALHAGSPGALELLGQVIREGLSAEDVVERLGLDGWSQIRSSAEKKAVEYDRRRAAAGVTVELRDSSGIEPGDLIRVGAPGIKAVRFFTLADGQRRWLTDKAVRAKQMPLLLRSTEYTIKSVDHANSTVTLG